MTRERKNLKRMKKCPRFHHCDVPICPLDTEKDKRVYLPGEPKCTLSKKLRMKLGKDLPWKGLFPREYAAWKRWKEGRVPEGIKKQVEYSKRAQKFGGSYKNQ